MISDFYARIKKVTNEIASLSERIPEVRIVQKVLRSLLERFDNKVTSIEDSTDTSTMRVDELIGSLKTHEMHIESRKRRKDSKKHTRIENIALNAKSTGAPATRSQVATADATEPSLEDIIHNLIKKWKTLKNVYR